MSEVPTKMMYGYGQNFMFRRITETNMNLLYNSKVMNSIMFGNKIILDCCYEKYMTPREISSCAKQLMLCFAQTRIHDYPFHIHMCNVDYSGLLMRKLKSYIPTLEKPEFPITVTTQSYLDIFDKKELVYMTPHVSNDIEYYDSNSTYIIGALVDKVSFSLLGRFIESLETFQYTL